MTDYAQPISEYEGEFSQPQPVAPTSSDSAPLVAPAQLQPEPMAVVAPTFAVPSPAAPAATQARRYAGLGLMFVAASAGAGAALGGAWGAGAGALFAGAARNLWRSQRLWSLPTGQPEATKSATVGLLGLGVAGYMAYRAHQRRSEQ